jgi:hypothetical protein
MYISQVAERLAALKHELDDLQRMNVRYWSQTKHTPLTTAAHESRRLRLTGIKNELGYMVKRAA